MADVYKAMAGERAAVIATPDRVPGLREAAVTRFEVIDRRILGKGRAFVAHDIAVELSYQDDGRTLKVFVTDRTPEAP